MIPLSVPNLGGNELQYVASAISDGWVSTGGPAISKFEDEFICYSGADYAAACQSGTAAIHLALLDAGVGAGDLVAAPALTFIASINPIRYVGADPVFIDCDDSLCIDPEKIEYYLHEQCEPRGEGVWYDRSQNRPLRAIIATHVFGNAADMVRLAEISKKYNLTLIEDAAEAVGTFYSEGPHTGKMAGTIGDYGAYSFNGNKIITTGGGGIFTSPSQDRVRRMKHMSTQAKTDDIYYMHDAVGYNYRMTNVQAAIGLAQIEQLETFIEKKRENYNLYREFGIELLPFRGDIRPNYWFYSYFCERNAKKFNESGDTARDALINYLNGRGIQTRPIWGLCCRQPMYARNRAYFIEKATYYYARVINLPCSTSLTREDVRRVAEEIKNFIV